MESDFVLSLVVGSNSSSSNKGSNAERSVLRPLLRHASAAKHTTKIPAKRREIKMVRCKTGIVRDA